MFAILFAGFADVIDIVFYFLFLLVNERIEPAEAAAITTMTVKVYPYHSHTPNERDIERERILNYLRESVNVYTLFSLIHANKQIHTHFFMHFRTPNLYTPHIYVYIRSRTR